MTEWNKDCGLLSNMVDHVMLTKTIWVASRKKDPYRSWGAIEKWRYIFAVKKLTQVCLKILSGLQSFWLPANTSKQCIISGLPPISHCAINLIIVLYKIMAVKTCVSLHEYLDIMFAENNAAAYTSCYGPHRKLIWQLCYYIFTNWFWNNVYKEKKTYEKKNILRALFVWRSSFKKQWKDNCIWMIFVLSEYCMYCGMILVFSEYCMYCGMIIVFCEYCMYRGMIIVFCEYCMYSWMIIVFFEYCMDRGMIIVFSEYCMFCGMIIVFSEYCMYCGMIIVFSEYCMYRGMIIVFCEYCMYSGIIIVFSEYCMYCGMIIVFSEYCMYCGMIIVFS